MGCQSRLMKRLFQTQRIIPTLWPTVKKNTTEELKILVTKITDMTNDIGELVTAPASQQVRHWLPGLIKDTSLIASSSNICVPALVTRWPEPKFAVFLKPVKGFRQL